MFYSLHTVAGSKQHTRIRKKMLEFFFTVLIGKLHYNNIPKITFMFQRTKYNIA